MAVFRMPSDPYVLVYKDAAASTRIVAAVVPVSDCLSTGGFASCWDEGADPQRGVPWGYIYLRLRDARYLRGQPCASGIPNGGNAVVYIDSVNARDSLVKCRSDTLIINRAIRIYRDMIQS